MNATSPDCAAPVNSRLGLILFLAFLALSLPQAALLPLLDRDEPRFAEAAREMIQSGNYVVPTFNGQPRYAKPPLIYWCQTVAYRLLGETAFAARLTSLLATAATALLLVTWGMKLGSAQVGAGAGLLYAFCFQTVQQGRVATADALLIFFMTLTAFTGWKILHPKEPGRVPAVCFIVLALGFAGGFLAKGPEALLPLLPLLWCARGAGRGVITAIVVSFLAGLALVLLWAIPAYVETKGDYWRVGMSEGVGQRMVTGLQGHGASGIGGYFVTLPLYLLLFWISALPWSPLLLIHRKKLFTGWKPDLTDSYLLLNAALIFVVFSLMVTKLPHYTLPAFPFLALAFARRWESVGLPKCRLTQIGWITGGAFVFLTAVIVPIAIMNDATPSPVGALVRVAEKTLTPDTQFAVVDFQEPNTVWESRSVIKGYRESIRASEVMTYLSQPGPHAVLLSTELWMRLAPGVDSYDGDPRWKLFDVRGVNAAKIIFPPPYYLPRPASVALTLVVKP